MSTVYCDEGLDVTANALSSALSTHMVIGMYKTPVALSNVTVFSDLTEADFAGYAAVAPSALSVVWDSVAMRWVITFPSHDFVHVGGSPANTVYGWFMRTTVSLGAPADRLVCAGTFSPAYFMSNVGDTIPLQVVLYVDQP